MNEKLINILNSCGIIKIPKNELQTLILPMVESIYHCPVRNKTGRSYEQVFASCSYVAIEEALCKVTGGIRNPKEFDHRDPDSYNYDVAIEDLKIEVKRHKTGSMFFTYPEHLCQKFMVNCAATDYVVTAYMEEAEDDYLVTFAMIARSDTFPQRMRSSKFNEVNTYSGTAKVPVKYYDHRNNPDCCIINLRQPIYK